MMIQFEKIHSTNVYPFPSGSVYVAPIKRGSFIQPLIDAAVVAVLGVLALIAGLSITSSILLLVFFVSF